MNEAPLVISVNRRIRPAEKVIRGTMGVFAGIFLLQGFLFSSGFMLPCFCMTLAFFIFGNLYKREYEYTFDNGYLTIERVSDMGRRVLHEIPYREIRLLCLPGAPEAATFKRGGDIRVKKYDYTSYQDDIPYYTMIVGEEPQRVKLLLDLTPESIALLRRACPGAVYC